MRNQKQNARLQQARGQLFICGIFGNCASSVLSPRTPPGVSEFGQKAAFVWAANDCAQIGTEGGDGVRHCERSEIDIPLSGPVPGSPSSASEAGDNASSSSTSDRMDQSSVTDARSSVASEAADLEDLLAEIKAGNFTKAMISALNCRLANQSSRAAIRASGVASSLVTLLLSSNLSADEQELPAEESLSALAVLADDVATTSLMATPEFLSVATWYVSKGRKDARDGACLILEKLSLEESFKGTMGSTPGVMDALNALLRDDKHLKLVKVATRTLLALCLLRDNRRRAVEVGAVASLLEMLPRARSATAEKALATLELLGTIDEGKAAMIEHALAVPVLVELILRVSDRGTEYAAGTLSAMCSDSVVMREAAVAHGAPTKLLLLIQSDCTARAKRKASQLLKVLHKIWVQDPCNPDSEGTKAIHF